MRAPCARSPSRPSSRHRARRCSTSSATSPPGPPTRTTSCDDYRLARVESGRASARPRASGSRRRWPSSTPSSRSPRSDRPRRIVEEIRVGRRGRNRSVAVYDFTRRVGGRHARGADHLQRAGHAWSTAFTRDGRRRVDAPPDAKALDRLRMIFEEPPTGPAQAGHHRGLRSRRRRPRFGVHAGMDPARASQP